MTDAYVDGKLRKVAVLLVHEHGLSVAFIKKLVRHVRFIPYSNFSWKSDDWYEVSRRIIE